MVNVLVSWIRQEEDMMSCVYVRDVENRIYTHAPALRIDITEHLIKERIDREYLDMIAVIYEAGVIHDEKDFLMREHYALEVGRWMIRRALRSNRNSPTWRLRMTNSKEFEQLRSDSPKLDRIYHRLLAIRKAVKKPKVVL